MCTAPKLLETVGCNFIQTVYTNGSKMSQQNFNNLQKFFATALHFPLTCTSPYTSPFFTINHSEFHTFKYHVYIQSNNVNCKMLQIYNKQYLLFYKLLQKEFKLIFLFLFFKFFSLEVVLPKRQQLH